MKIKLIPLLTLFIIQITWPCLGQTIVSESALSMDTYHTSPYGSYTRVRLIPREKNADITNACDMSTIGLVYIEKPSAEQRSIPHFCNIVNDAAQWSLISSVWEEEGSFVYPMDNTTSLIRIGPPVSYALPSETMLLISSTDAVDFIIEADINNEDGNEDSQPSLTLREQYDPNPEAMEARLGFINSSNNLSLSATTAGGKGQMIFNTSGGFLLLNDDDNNAIADTSPDAYLEISHDNISVPSSNPAKNIFAISSEDPSGDPGNILLIEKTGPKKHIGINGGGSLNGILSIKSDDSDESNFGIGSEFAMMGQEFMMDGGSDGIARFVHYGDSNDQLIFASILNPVFTILTNEGTFSVAQKTEIGGNGPEQANLFITDETWDSDASNHSILDMFWVLSDGDTSTGINEPPGCQYITYETIGVITSGDSQTATTLSSGLSITGLSDPSIPALHLNGIIGAMTTNDGPAVAFDGFKNNGAGDFTSLGTDDIIFRTNYWDSSGISFLTILDNGYTGIGMNAGNPQPTQKLHVRHIMRLEPQTTAPECDTTQESGNLYADDSGALCYCDGTNWNKMAGPGDCI